MMTYVTEANDETCEWIWSHPKFRDWISASRSKILLVSGKPGCGKSVLAKYVQTNLSTHLGYQSAYFFFSDRGNEIEKITSGMIRALLYQICHHKPSLFYQLPLLKTYEELKKDGNANVEWPPSILRKLFLSLRETNDSSTFYLIIDSLDEAKAGETAPEVAKLLKQLASWNGSCRFKIFITSRPPTLLQEFDDHPWPRISLEKRPDSQYVEIDIEKYISNKVTLELRRYAENLQPIKVKLRDRSNCVFLWVDLMMKRLVEEGRYGTTTPDLEKIVEATPSGEQMEKMYQNILSRLDWRRASVRSIMLQWVLYSERPLTLKEFRIAVTINCHPGRYNSEATLIGEMNMDLFKLRVESHCGGLVEFTENDMAVQLIHQSAKDYLLQNTREWIEPRSISAQSQAQSQLAETCLTYLSFPGFAEGPTEDTYPFSVSSKYNDRLQHHHLLKYAALHWSKHLNMSPESIESLCHRVCEFAKTPQFLLSFQVSRFERHLFFSGGELLHLVSDSGHAAVVKLLLGTGKVDVDSKDARGQTPLSWAAQEGHEAVVKLLQSFIDMKLVTE